jgi:hypothetical protein
MQQNRRAEVPLHRTEAGGPGMSRLSTAMAAVGAIVLLAAIAFVLGATFLT